MTWHCSFILAECSALGEQTAPVLWGDPEWYCLWGQHHVTVKISPSLGFFQSQIEQEGEAFHSCSLSVRRPAGQVVVLRGWSFAALGTWRQAGNTAGDTAGNTAGNAVPAAPGSYTRVNACARFAQTPLETWAQRLSLSLARNLNVECVWGGVLVALRLKHVQCHVQCMLLFAKWHLQEKPSFTCISRHSTVPLLGPVGDHSTVSVVWCCGLHVLLHAWNLPETIKPHNQVLLSFLLYRLSLSWG